MELLIVVMGRLIKDSKNVSLVQNAHSLLPNHNNLHRKLALFEPSPLQKIQ